MNPESKLSDGIKNLIFNINPKLVYTHQSRWKKNVVFHSPCVLNISALKSRCDCKPEIFKITPHHADAIGLYDGTFCGWTADDVK